MTTATALTNVRVFDGERILAPATVVIDQGLIAADGAGTAGADVIDCGGAVLLPGLIDAHVHLTGQENLAQLASYGVTTALDMATWPPKLLASLRGVPGRTDIRSAGTPAIGPGGPHAKIPGMAGDALVLDPDQAQRFVAARIAEGSDYLKIVLEAPGQGGPDQATVDALVDAARAGGMATIAHASSAGAFEMALAAGVAVVTHVPLGPPLGADVVARLVDDGVIAVPTLTMMEGIAGTVGRPEAFGGALLTVGALHRAGVPILAGTDANSQQGVPYQVKHGESLHHELELLVSAGLSTVEALRAATNLPARHFGLDDRGAIRPGLRADLVLIDGDPVADIRATRKIQRIWCGGVEVAPA